MCAKNFDVIVAGSGPAGSTASTLLAQAGHSVLMLERDQHPRFHIGESLLPLSEPIFQRLGVTLEEGEYLPKGGAEFINESTDMRARFPLAAAHQPYQVERSKFDLLMVENAVENGVVLHQHESVQSVNINPTEVAVDTNKEQYTGRYFIDATGRSALMGRKLKSVERIANLGRYALYAHYSQASSETAKSLFKSGDIKILLVDIGWIWVIPLVGGRLSVGLVVHDSVKPKKKGAKLFEQYVSDSVLLGELLINAHQEAEVRAEADFSFYNAKRYGNRFACCGDASGFLDPVFSSGVLLAVTSAERVADRLSTALNEGEEGMGDLHSAGDADYMLGLNSMLLFIERFYHNDLVGRLLFEANRNEKVKADIMGLLGGDLWTGSNDFQKKLLESRQSTSAIL